MKYEARIRYLKCVYGHIKSVCIYKGDTRYEGVLLDKNWDTFEDFVKDNWFRYYRALLKWRNHKPFHSNTFKNSVLRFTRKIKGEGYVKLNTCFTSPSDSKKYHTTSHKVMFDEIMLGTRDVKNILKKKGINLKTGLISERLKVGKDIFVPHRRNMYKWNGKYTSLIEISKNENINLGVLKHYLNKKGYSLEKSIQVSKGKGNVKIDFEGGKITKQAFFKILSFRSGVHFATIRIRYKKHGMDIQKITSHEHGNIKTGIYSKR